MKHFVAAFVLLLTLFAFTAHAQDFPEIFNSEEDPNAQPVPAAEAAAGFSVDDGFVVKVFAQEPDVQNPIAMTWDSRGRLWVAENFTYAKRSERFNLGLRDRLLIFEDSDGDGVADKRTVFTDQLQMLTSVEVGHGGVWLMCPSQLLFLPDRDHDDQPDGPAVTVLDGFEVAKVNHHNFANGLKWGPDGWLYGRCGGSCPGSIGAPGTPKEQRVPLEGGIWRYHPGTKHFEVLSHGTTNPWGHDWNEFGDGFFINTVNGHLWHLIPGAHFDRPFTLDPNPHVYELIDMHADHWHFDTKGHWSKSRDGAANDFGGGHAHCGVSIYLGGRFPDEYHGRLMTLNFHGRRINQEILERSGSGYVGKHGKDTLIASDPFFRGMEVSYGPDGNLTVLDWSDTGECHEASGVHRTSGRIYGVHYQPANQDATKPALTGDLRSRSSVELAGLLKHKNEWFARQTRLILAERASASVPDQAQDFKDAVEAIKLQLNDADPKIAYRAFTTLLEINADNQSIFESVLSHSNEHLRAWAIRGITDHWPIDDVLGPNFHSRSNESRVTQEYAKWEQAFCELARKDPSGLVRLNLASTLQRLPPIKRAPLATALMSRKEDASDHNLPLLVWYGLIPVADSDPVALAKAAVKSTWPKTQNQIARRLALDIEKSPEAIGALLESVAADPKAQKNILLGLHDGLNGWSHARKPAAWQAVLTATTNSPDKDIAAIVQDMSIVFGDGRALEDVRAMVLNRKADIGIRRTALETLVRRKPEGVADICLELLSDSKLNTVALRGVSGIGSEKVAQSLIKNYRRFRGPNRPRVIEVLSSRVVFANALFDAIKSEKISSADLTAYDVRQIGLLGDDQLAKRVAELWGEVRDTPAEKSARMKELEQLLSTERLSQASLGDGRVLFNKSCAKCHRLFGQGEEIGPDLTGANRSNLDYLLENIVDPSAVVSKNFSMTVVVTTDGQTLSGLVTNRTEKTLSIQTQNELKTIAIDDIEATKPSSLSPMPDGMLDNLSEAEITNLISYLMQPTQVPLPGEKK